MTITSHLITRLGDYILSRAPSAGPHVIEMIATKMTSRHAFALNILFAVAFDYLLSSVAKFACGKKMK